jgi:hypothetical protein
VAAGAVVFIAGEMAAHHHQHKVEVRAEAHAHFQADMDRIMHPQPVHHAPVPDAWMAPQAHHGYWFDGHGYRESW